MKHRIIAMMVLALVEFHLGGEVDENWFAQYGMARDMTDGDPLEVVTEEEEEAGATKNKMSYFRIFVYFSPFV